MKVLQEITVPHESVNDQSLIVLELLCANGEQVKAGAVIAELETSKTTISVEVQYDGYVQYYCKAGDDLKVNALIAKVWDEVPDLTTGRQAEISSISETKKVNAYATKTVFSKRALEMMTSLGISEAAFSGKDFVSVADVKKLANISRDDNGHNKPRESHTREVARMTDDLSKVDVVKITSLKQKEIEYLSEVQSSGLISVINANLELDGVLEYINRYLAIFKNSLLPIIAYECGKLLLKYPNFNAYFNTDSVAYFKEVHIGFAVDLGKGLKVLRIPNTSRKSVREIEEEIMRLSNAYIDDSIKLNDLTDVTFTITDLSAEKVHSFIPLINMKNSAILGISSVDHQLKRAIVSLAFDHRVTTGKEAAAFLADLKSRVESNRDSVISRNMGNVVCHKCAKKISEDLSEAGFVKCVTRTGEDAYICQACFKGF